jgi:hypothetical protein
LNYPQPEEELGLSGEWGGNWEREIKLGVNGDDDDHEDHDPHKDALKIGDMTIGLAYETDNKKNARTCGQGVRKLCRDSERHIAFLRKIEEQLKYKVHRTLRWLMDDTLRCNIIRGARTIDHTDTFKGNHYNWLYIDSTSVAEGESPGCLVYDLFPRFRYSVIKLDGKYYIPKHYSGAADEVVLIGENPKKPGYPIYHIFPKNAIDRMEPVGDLPFGVVGWKANGDIQVIPEWEDVCLYESPFNPLTYKWDVVIQFALERPATKPKKRYILLNEMDKWQRFKAYMYRHWWIGNHLTTRFHVYFRSIRCATTSANVIRNGKGKPNFISHKLVVKPKSQNKKVGTKSQKSTPKRRSPRNQSQKRKKPRRR